LIPEEKDALFRVIEDPRDRAIFRLAYHHGLRASEIGMIQTKDWHRGTSLDMDRAKAAGGDRSAHITSRSTAAGALWRA
jgi:integrase